MQDIYEMGNNIDWENSTLTRIKPLIEATKKRLRDKENSGANKP